MVITLYDILEVSQNASEDVIKMAYKGLVKKYHPDIFEGDKSFAEAKIKEINNAYEVLSNPFKRREYDEKLKNFQEKKADYENITNYKATTHSAEQKSTNEKKLKFLIKWPFVCFVLFVAIRTENSVIKFLGLMLIVIRIFFSLANPQFKTSGVKRFVTLLVVCALVFSSFSKMPNVINNHEDKKAIIQEKVTPKTISQDIDYILYGDGNFLIWYLYKNDIRINVENEINNVKAECTNIYNSSTQADLKMLRYEKELFTPGYYTLTNKELQTDAFYLGQLSDNKPNGYGFIMDTDGNIEYFGEFKNGMRDGIGLLFEKTFTISSLLQYPEEELAKYYGNDLFSNIKQNINNRCVYMGEFKRGKKHGKGNTFEWEATSASTMEREGAEIHIMVIVGTYDEDAISGKYKQYMRGTLCAEGNVSSTGTGEIKEYFPESTQVEYAGRIKNWKRHGKGILYDKLGNVIYNGQWRYGDYK